MTGGEPFALGYTQEHGKPFWSLLSSGSSPLSRAAASDIVKRLDGNELAEPDSGRHPEAVDRDYSAEARTLLDRRVVTDPLLHRGLYKLLMATELLRHTKFLEEAGLSALISREAALELLRRKLSADAGERFEAG